MTVRRLALVVTAGVLVTTLAALGTGMPWADALTLSGISIGTGCAVGAAGWCALLGARRRSVGFQAVVVALAVVAAVGAGVLVAASQMFINGEDLAALLVVLPAAGTVGIVAALMLGHHVGSASRSLAGLVRRLEDDGPAGEWGGSDGGSGRRGSGELAGELAGLARELAATQARLAESRARAQAVEASRRELVAWVSHDLRTPLSGIRAMVEALEDGVVDDAETVARYYRTIRLETVRLAKLVDELFELSRIGAHALRLSPEPASLTDLVSDALAAATPAAEAKGIGLDGRVVGSGPSVELSTPEFGRALRNLIDNAIRHTPPGGTVTIDAGYEERSATVTVLDSCGGIPAGELERVFEVAYRGDAARGREGGGAGLGLAIARGLIEAQQGEIVVDNRGRGCAFTVRLPLGHNGPDIAEATLAAQRR
ncbi:MAG TPA: ATP-binding protein [Acidimicrobiales bacterium]|nr:ATP-binding protein [Acidimicrobiales bacterium]